LFFCQSAVQHDLIKAFSTISDISMVQLFGNTSNTSTF